MLNTKSLTKENTLQTKKKYDVSVVIVNYNSGNYLKETVESLQKCTTDIDYEIIIIDNKSSENDESLGYINNEFTNIEKTKFIKSNINRGYGPANNIAINQSNGRNILILNPDVIFGNNTIKILSDFLDNNPKVGMVGPKVLNQNATFQASCMRGLPKPLSVFFHITKLKFFEKHPDFYIFSMENKNNNEIQEVAGLSGCCMMVKKELIDEIGTFDEQFFLYQEETDWCYRAYKEGWSIVYNPNAIVTHYQGVTTKKNLARNTYIFCQSMMKFFKKHHWKNYNIFQKTFWTILIWGNFILKYFKVRR